MPLTKSEQFAGARKSSYEEMNDDFPTPPWATRAFFKYVAPNLVTNARRISVLEPANGRGYITKVLKELKFKVAVSDNADYGGGDRVADYLVDKFKPYDLMVTNPPYKHSNAFVMRGVDEAVMGVAVLMRTLWVTGKFRYDNLFGPRPPSVIAVFSRNMSATRGKVIRRGSNVMSHSWFYWDKTGSHPHGKTEFMWIPPGAQSELERDEDYL